MPTITICGSMRFFEDIERLKRDVEQNGFTVFTPIKEGSGVDYAQLTKQQQAEVKQRYIDQHIEKIKQSDAILVANYTKGDKKDYIGANTFLEMAFAYILQKPIFILNDIPEQENTVEIAGLKPRVLNGDLSSLR